MACFFRASIRSSLRDLWFSDELGPSDKSLGYCHVSLRDKSRFQHQLPRNAPRLAQGVLFLQAVRFGGLR